MCGKNKNFEPTLFSNVKTDTYYEAMVYFVFLISIDIVGCGMRRVAKALPACR